MLPSMKNVESSLWGLVLALQISMTVALGLGLNAPGRLAERSASGARLLPVTKSEPGCTRKSTSTSSSVSGSTSSATAMTLHPNPLPHQGLPPNGHSTALTTTQTSTFVTTKTTDLGCGGHHGLCAGENAFLTDPTTPPPQPVRTSVPEDEPDEDFDAAWVVTSKVDKKTKLKRFDEACACPDVSIPCKKIRNAYKNFLDTGVHERFCRPIVRHIDQMLSKEKWSKPCKETDSVFAVFSESGSTWRETNRACESHHEGKGKEPEGMEDSI